MLLLGPAAGFSILGWKSVVYQQEVREIEMDREAYDVLAQRMRAAVADLELLKRKEDARHYYEYQVRYMPKGQSGSALMFQESELAREPVDQTKATVGSVGWKDNDPGNAGAAGNTRRRQSASSRSLGNHVRRRLQL